MKIIKSKILFSVLLLIVSNNSLSMNPQKKQNNGSHQKNSDQQYRKTIKWWLPTAIGITCVFYYFLASAIHSHPTK